MPIAFKRNVAMYLPFLFFLVLSRDKYCPSHQPFFIHENNFLKCFVYRLFEEHGDLLKLFNKFRECKTKEEQSTSEELAEHANKVMETLDEGIRGLDDLDSFFDYLHQVGASHTRIPGFKAEYFWVSNILFIDLRQSLPIYLHLND